MSETMLHMSCLLHVYWDFRRKDVQKADDLLASRLKQRAQKQSSFPTSVKDLYDQ